VTQFVAASARVAGAAGLELCLVVTGQRRPVDFMALSASRSPHQLMTHASSAAALQQRRHCRLLKSSGCPLLLAVVKIHFPMTSSPAQLYHC